MNTYAKTLHGSACLVLKCHFCHFDGYLQMNLWTENDFLFFTLKKNEIFVVFLWTDECEYKKNKKTILCFQLIDIHLINVCYGVNTYDVYTHRVNCVYVNG